jgi:chromosome segregation ATPase
MKKKLEEELSKARADCEELRGENAKFNTENSRLLVTNKNLNDDLVCTKLDFARLKQQTDAIINSITADNHKLDAKNDDLIAKKSDLSIANTGLAAANNELAAQNSRLLAENTRILAAYEASRGEIDELTSQLVAMSDQVGECSDNNSATYQRETVYLKEQLELAQSKLKRSEDKVIEIQEAHSRDVSLYSTQLAQSKRECVALNNTITATDNRYRGVLDELAQCKQENAELRQRISAAEKTIREATDVAARMGAEGVVSTGVNNHKFDETKQLRDANKELSEHNAELLQDKAFLLQQNKQLQARLADLKQCITAQLNAVRHKAASEHYSK